MKPLVKITLIFFIFLFTAVSSGAAGGYYGHGYTSYGSRHNYYNYRSHSSGSDQFWIYLGAGLLSGVLVSAIVNARPRQRTVIYEEPWQSVVYEQPRRGAVVYRTPPRTIFRIAPPQLTTLVPQENYRQRELILSRVETTPQLLNIRVTPDPDADITGQLQRGTIVGVIGAAPDWLYIKTDSGHYGWVMLQYTRPAGGPVG